MIFNQSEDHDEVISKIELDYFIDDKKEIEKVDRHEKDIQKQEIVKEQKEEQKEKHFEPISFEDLFNNDSEF